MQTPPNEAKSLSSLAVRSKAHWGYSVEFMKACINELTVTHGDIENSDCHYAVAMIEEKIVGFYSLKDLLGAEVT